MIRSLVITATAAVALLLGWQWLFPSDEAQIVAVRDRVAEGVSGGADNNDVERLTRAASLGHELAPDVTVDAGPPFGRLVGRDAVIGAAARTGGRVRQLQITFPDVSIAVASDGQSATAVVTAEARFDDGGGRSVDARELELGFKRADDRWVISTITLLEALQRLP